MTVSASVIQTQQLSKSFGKVEAIRQLDLNVEPARITAFLGLNGAGKSTTIKMLLGIIHPTSGDAKVLGKRINDPTDGVALRRKIAYVIWPVARSPISGR
jgi:ABC-2 type transport system ATP-binding protein